MPNSRSTSVQGTGPVRGSVTRRRNGGHGISGCAIEIDATNSDRAAGGESIEMGAVPSLTRAPSGLSTSERNATRIEDEDINATGGVDQGKCMLAK